MSDWVAKEAEARCSCEIGPLGRRERFPRPSELEEILTKLAGWGLMKRLPQATPLGIRRLEL